MNGCFLTCLCRVLNEESYRNRSTSTLTENVATFFTTLLTTCSSISTEIENVYVGKFRFEASSETGLTYAVKPRTVTNKSYNTTIWIISNTIRSPAESLDEAIV